MLILHTLVVGAAHGHTIAYVAVRIWISTLSMRFY